MIPTQEDNFLIPILKALRLSILLLILGLLLVHIFNSQVECSIAPIKEDGDLTSMDKVGCECISKTGGLYNQMSLPGIRCCPTKYSFFHDEQYYCEDLPLGAPCTFDKQCLTQMCHPENSNKGFCVSRRPQNL